MASPNDNPIELKNSNSEEKQTHKRQITPAGLTRQHTIDPTGYDARSKSHVFLRLNLYRRKH
jgi:hypothetical protein